MKNNRLESIITQSLERFYSRLMPILNSKQPKESGKGLTKNDLTDELKGKYDEAVNMSHGHANKNILDNTNASFTTALKGNYDDAVNKSHTHSNKTILDNTNESFTTDIKTQINMNKSNISTVADYINDSDLTTDSESKMVKTVPTNANHACGISKIGGRTQKMVQLVSEDLASVHNVTLDSSSSKYSYAIAYRKGHVYMMSAKSNTYPIRFQVDSKYGVCKIEVDSNARYLTKFTCNYPDFSSGAFIYNTSSSSYAVTGNFLIFDLTEMGIPDITEADFRAMFPEDYYPYTEGELWNTPVESVVSFPQNIWNEKWEVGSIHVDTGSNKDDATAVRSKEYTYIGNAKIIYTTYKYLKPRFYSANKTYIGYGIADNLNENMIYVPDGAKYFRFSTQSDYGNTYKNDICISLSEASYTPHTFDETTLLIPSEFKNLPGYGLGIDDTNYNIIDFENGTYHYNVEKYKLGNDSKVQMPETGLFFVSDFTSHGSALCNKYKFVDINEIIDNKSALSFLNEGEFTYRHGSTNDRLYFKDSSIANAEEFITKNLDMEVVCTLPSSEKKIEPLANYIYPIRCESGGTITLQNEHNLDMPNTVVYKKEVSLS